MDQEQLPTAEREGGAARGLQDTLEKIRAEGNELFRKGDWTGAASKYTECIDRANESETTIADTPRECQKEAMLAYANRAEARLRLNAYQDALSDSAKALDLDPKHVKTLLRRGSAEHGLGQFDLASKTFAEALALASKNDRSSILQKLEASETAHVQCRQSRYGEYDLTDYHLKGKAVECADFVGPVEIRRVNYGSGKRGLFATQNVTPGQILLVSNPLIIGECNNRSQERMQKDFINRVIQKSKTSKRCRAQLHSMVLNGEEEMNIPSMELFTPGSEWAPSGTDDLDIDAEAVTRIVLYNALGVDNGRKIGVWVLPSFTNHSCAPNCVMIFVGDAIFLRASGVIMAGDELTMTYSSQHLLCPRHIRQQECWKKSFACRCERCQLEDEVNRVAATAFTVRVDERRAEEMLRSIQPGYEGPPNFSRTVELVDIVQKVEGEICIRQTELEPKKQSWLRAAYIDAYWAKYKSELGNKSPTRISTLRQAVDAMAYVGFYPGVLGWAALLVWETEQVESKRSTKYKHTEERALEIFKVFYGESSTGFLWQMMRMKAPMRPADPTKRVHQASRMGR